MATEPGHLVLVRHGATEWSAVDKHTGRTDLPLTDAGKIEAEKIKSRLATWRFDRVFASPLQRARHTAGLAGFPTPVIDDDLMEWDYGEHEGRTTVDIRTDDPSFSKWHQRPPGGESVEDVGARVDRFLNRITEGQPADGVVDDVVVFAHGHLLAILIARWLGLSPGDGVRFPLRTATLTVLGNKRECSVIHMLNG